MTDFVGRILRPEKYDWIIRSLMDVDFYKFTMGLFIFRLHRGVRVKIRLINRNPTLPLADIIDEEELRAQLDHVRTLRFRRTDRIYLRGQDVYGTNMFPEDYLAFLGELQMTPYTLTRVGNQYELTFEGPWEVVTFWETIALAIISELFYRTLMREMTEDELRILYARAENKIFNKLRRIKARESIRFADFGQRRRHSFLWQRRVIEMCRNMLLETQFSGTSNTWMAFNQDLIPIGTNAHELPMVLTALAETAEAKRMAQYDVLREWGKHFPHALRIALPDTYGSVQFWKNMPQDLAEDVVDNWRGFRQDSGEPIPEIHAYLAWLKKFGGDPQEKLVIPSDGLDIGPMMVIDEAFQGVVPISNGWGTMLTNDFVDCHPRGTERAVVRGQPLTFTWNDIFRGHSIVCKVESANGRPAVKLSNNIKKATGPKDEVQKYLQIFGYEGQTSQDVMV